MDEHNSEILKRLEKIEQELSELRGKVDALTGSAALTTQKKPRKKLFLYFGIPILLLCLLVGGYYVFRITRTPEPVEAESETSYAEVEIGDIITFGKYEQNNSEADGSEPIEWIVLDKQDSRLLLLSKYILFKSQNQGMSWNSCSLRNTLNTDFVSIAFTPDEQSEICRTIVEEGGNASTDRTFLLSEEEAILYFPSEESRICDYSVSSRNGSSAWTLRSYSVADTTDKHIYQNAYVSINGEIEYHQFLSPSSNLTAGVRPALWLDTTK